MLNRFKYVKDSLTKCRVAYKVFKNKDEVDKEHEEVKKEYALFKIIDFIKEIYADNPYKQGTVMHKLKNITYHCNSIIEERFSINNQIIRNNKMDTVNKTNRWRLSLENCSQSMKYDVKYILDIFRTNFERDIIKKYEYRKYLMIITNNCNDYIQTYLHIDEKQLENKILLKKKNIEYLISNDDLYEKQVEFKRESNNEDTFHSFLEYNGLLNDSNLNHIFKLLHYQLGQFSVYIYISKVDDNNYKIYDLNNDDDLTYTEISSITKKFSVRNADLSFEEPTYELKVRLTYYKTKKEYDLTANMDFEKEYEQDDEEDDVQYDNKNDNNSDLLSYYEIDTIKKIIERQLEKEKQTAIQTAIQTAKQTAIQTAKQTAKQTAIRTGVNGGYAKSSKFKTKEVLGKLRRVYKIPNSKKEHIKHKGNLITVSEYKAVMKLKNKI